MPHHARVIAAGTVAVVLATSANAVAQSALSGDPITIRRAAGPITVDGNLEDQGWRDATRVDKWYETNPGDNLEPAVRNVGYITYDDRFFYAGFEFDDPSPSAIRAPYTDRDQISGNATDYGGVILDTRNDGHSGVLLLATATGIQYDAASDDDGSGENSSPDFFWESSARITSHGWTLELRVPFSSLRYRNVDPQRWGIMLYRNHPRAFRYQYFSAKLPRGGNCFICRANTLVGLSNLPAGGHLVAAPYAAASATGRPAAGLGTSLVNDPLHLHTGIDVKWTPNADNALDFTANPDFSQVEADTAQISANERFALSFPEKRPFFLEGVELFSTPLRAVHTRTITAPRWGARATGKVHGIGYTALVADDEGGGSIVLPGPMGSSPAPQDFGSTVLVARAKRSIGRSFVSLLVTDREAHDANGHNRLFGPDFQWRPTGPDVIAGQWLVSHTRVPNRPELAAAWTGQAFGASAGTLEWNRNTPHLDLFGHYRALGDGFRADTGFIPQVGYRQIAGGGGWTIRPQGFLSRQRTFLNVERQVDTSGALLNRSVTVGAGMDTRFSGFTQVRYQDDRIRSGAPILSRRRFGYVVQFSPSRRVAQVGVDGNAGEEIDFANSRVGRGGAINLNGKVNPTDHLELAVLENHRWLSVDAGGTRRRLFTARVSRVRGTYTFTARTFLRIIGQYASTDRDPALYIAPTAPRSATFSGSALLAYKINWQSVLFLGYGDDRELSDQHQLEKATRQFFVKISYAFQR